MKVIPRAIAKFFTDADILILGLSMFSIIFGLIIINSIVRNMPGNMVTVQIVSVVIGLGLFILFSYVDIDIIADKSAFLMIFSVLLISSLVIWGTGDYETGNNAWIRFEAGFGIQPAEIVKIPYIIILAKMLSSFKERKTINNFLSLLQIVAVCGIVVGLILVVSDDMGSALVYVFIVLVMMFVGGVKLRWFLLAGAVVAAVFPFLWNFLEPFQQARILAPYARFFPDLLSQADYERFTWQVNISINAIASGGLTGLGLGNGAVTQSPGRLFAHHTDFIFAAIAEELGFLGALLAIVLLVLVIVRCVYVGTKSNNSLGMLVCTGISAMLIFHVIINVGMSLGVMPVIGISLPFFSYGGSAIVTCLAAMGIVSGIKMRPKTTRFRSL